MVFSLKQSDVAKLGLVRSGSVTNETPGHSHVDPKGKVPVPHASSQNKGSVPKPPSPNKGTVPKKKGKLSKPKPPRQREKFKE